MADNPGSVSNFPHLASDDKIPKVVAAVSDVHDTVDKVAAKANDAVGSISPAINRAADAAHQAVDKLTGVAATSSEWLSQQSDVLVTKGRSAEADARAYVAAHPWQSIFAAVAFGYLLGRRHHHR